ncbi:ATP-binding protein [Pseudoduganella violacea]|uniref:Energy-coupling factor transporter ATP-binding protein EcfA2 n=1 Tax=Pseudoduganella violacea TaxID=1715466 RepID=A0A7W5BDV4_9BURK|nr:ATP-binding protein [Pseudoduganella violacea]MBB3121364.1 energy-coupling factor transporter ATP-binding protein EcfA2 [Pseudoduganella violacea]
MPPDDHINRVWTSDPLRAPAPRSVEDTGLPFLYLVELVSKVLYQRGQVRLSELSAHLKLPVSVLDPLLTFLRTERMCEAVRRGVSNTDADLVYNLSDAGRARAAEYERRDSYAGPAPVAFADYVERVRASSVAGMRVGREHMAQAFDGIVADPQVLEKMGAAMNSGRAIFVHGPAGSGKTFLAERLNGLLNGHIAVPYALLIDGDVVPLFDPMVHHVVPDQEGGDRLYDRRAPRDQRWVRAQRPAVLTGGELTLEMLDLRFDATTRLYQAPPHLKANGGIFIIDDLGRQRCSATELMNRWIVPLDRQVDYLSLQNGYKFPVPFDVVVVFSSNLPPESLADGSFLRRLGYKIHIGPLTPVQYGTVFRQVCERLGIAFAPEAFAWLLAHHDREQRPLMACYPRDLVCQLRDLAAYEGRQPELSSELLAWAWDNYFAGA